MVRRVDALDAQQMIGDGVALIDALPAEVFQQEHLPGAVNIPLATFEPTRLETYDRAAELLVYCFDQH
jgi:rhodanese-related sulfurtransferase